MIRNIVFDIGNVLVDFCWQDHIAGYGFREETAKRLGKAMMLSPVWNELDRGVWTNEELLQGFIANDPELEQEIRTVFSDLSTLIREKDGSKDWICSLKDLGYGVYYLSNFSERVKAEAESQLSFLEEMNGGIMSCTVHLIKPDPEIYERLFKWYGLKPEESVFLDDSPANIETAKQLGMYGILVESRKQAVNDLQKLLKQINGQTKEAEG